MRDMYFNTTITNPDVCRPLVANLIQLGQLSQLSIEILILTGLLSEGTARRRFPALVPPLRLMGPQGREVVGVGEEAVRPSDSVLF